MKTKQILLTLLMTIFLATSFFTFSCSNPKDNNSKDGMSTISLLEAKQMIVGELEVEDLQVNILDEKDDAEKDSESKKNRNIFQKLKVSDFECSWSDGAMPDLKGKLQKQNKKWTAYSLIQGEDKEYFSKNIVYQVRNNNKSTTTFESSMFGSIIESIDLMFVYHLFDDDAWEEIYEDKAEKNKSKDDIVIKLNVNTAKFMNYITRKAKMNKLPTDGLFGEGELLEKNKQQGNVKLSMKFHKEKLVGMNYSITSLAVNGSIDNTQLITTTIKVNKSKSQQIIPEWFNSNDYNSL